MSRRRVTRSCFLVLTILLILNPGVVRCQESSRRINGATQSQIRIIPFSVTAGVPVGRATIRAFSLISFPLDDPALFVPTVHLPPQADSFVVQTVADLSGLESANRLNFDLFFTVVKEDGIIFSPGPIRLFVSILTAQGNALVSGRSMMKDQIVDLKAESPLKAAFSFVIGPCFGQSDYMIVQVGRHANQTTEDMNPGTVRLHAVRINAGRE